MRITALALDGNRGWPDLRLDHFDAGLNVFYGPEASAKTTLADLVAHVLYGQRLVAPGGTERVISPEGELIVESRGRKYRLRRYHDSAAADRLTVAALDGAAVDRETVRQLVSGLPSSLLRPLFVLSFREAARLDGLLSDGFCREFQLAVGAGEFRRTSPPQDGLLKRRDVLAEEIEARIADQRQKSRELDERWHELDGLVHGCKQELEQSRDRLRAVDTELAEIESWLRCRQLGREVDRQPTIDKPDAVGRFADLDEQIGRWRAALAELERRRVELHTQRAQLQPNETSMEILLVDQRAYLVATRQLFADLQGEVARLARANQSDECVCGDAHPRIRPIMATLMEQLDALEALADQQERTTHATELEAEADHLARSQVELRSQLEHLLDRRQSLDRSTRRRSTVWPVRSAPAAAPATARRNGLALCATTPLDELASRRIELWRERGRLHDELARLEPRLRNLRVERDEVERQRTEVLSLRANRELEQQLAEVQQELERSMNAPQHSAATVPFPVGVGQASDFLAQITDGELVQLRPGRHQADVYVVNRCGDSRQLDSLSPAERDQVRLSLCLAMLTACGQRGIRLPLIMDDPFQRLDGRETTALTAVIDEFARRGQQLLLFTAQPSAVERFAALGAQLHDMASLFQQSSETQFGLVSTASAAVAVPSRVETQHLGSRRQRNSKSKSSRREAG